MEDAESKHAEPENTDGLFRLTIIMDGDGGIRLEGVIGNLPLAYGALELAKDALRRYHAEKNKPRIQAPSGMHFPFGGPRNGG